MGHPASQPLPTPALQCELDDEDDKYYDDEEVAARVKLNKALASKHLDLEYGEGWVCGHVC